MRLLILGGTRFVGRHLVEAARARDHDVTVFHRGRSGRNMWPDVEEVIGDRESDLPGALGDNEWDAAIDTSAYVPRVVRTSLEALTGRVGSYTFVSTISVYAAFDRPGLDEVAPLAELDDPTTEEVTDETYGGLKVLCEREVLRAFGDGSFVVRPGFVVGPHDHTDRFTYWIDRIARGGRIACPPPPEAPAQFIDARDLGSWIVRSVENGVRGTFNAVGPGDRLTFESWFERTRDVTGSDAHFIWVPESAITKLGLEESLPLWSPQSEADYRFAMDVDASAAISKGLEFRSLEDTVRDTLAWSRAERTSLTAGLSADDEVELLREAEVRA